VCPARIEKANREGKGMATESWPWPRANLCSLPHNSLLVHYIIRLFRKEGFLDDR
jgi:hypothetical protein